MKIQTQIKLKGLDGKEFENELTLGQALGNILSSSEEGGKMKLYILGSKLYQEKEVEVDESDLNLIKNAVKGTKIYTALIAGQCEKLLGEIENEKDK